MAYDGWVEFGDVELFNLARTTQLAVVLGIDTVWIDPAEVQWIETALGGSDYDVISETPWFDPNYPASAEFAGIIPLSLAGLNDSSLESTPIEYVTDGGNVGKTRHKTLDIVANVAVVASTERGAEFGKRWLDKVLRGGRDSTKFCSGSDLTYFRYAAPEGGVPPKVHRRNVGLSRGTSVTRRHTTWCSSTWLVTFTLVAADPFEYSEEFLSVADLGGTPFGPGLINDGVNELMEQTCPQFDYTPFYDPLRPALLPPPEAPDFFPEGWDIEDGMPFRRYWAEVTPVQPSSLDVVPVIRLETASEARRVRVSILGQDGGALDQCDPLWSAVISFVPVTGSFVIDGEQQATYLWDGLSEFVRRADSLVFSPEAAPVEWRQFNDSRLFVALDVFYKDGSVVEGDGTLRAEFAFVQKSD